jgi:hypothetical protein
MSRVTGSLDSVGNLFRCGRDQKCRGAALTGLVRLPLLVLLDSDAKVAADFRNPCASSTRVDWRRDWGVCLVLTPPAQRVLLAVPVSLPSRCALSISWRPLNAIM